MKNQKKNKAPHYRVNIEWSAVDKCYVARVPELQGCVADGETYLEAAKNIQEVMELYLETLEEEGQPFPEAMSNKKFNGKIAVRVDPATHRDAMAKAMIEQVSLNQFIERAMKKAI